LIKRDDELKKIVFSYLKLF